jgi:hypothetical protein
MSQKLNIVCVTGTREKLQMAAMFASVAAATGGGVPGVRWVDWRQYLIKGPRGEPPRGGEMGERM